MSTADPITHVGVGVIVVRHGLVLLGRRIGSRGAGTWALPGGHLEVGESPEDCAVREVREETGLEVERLTRGPYSSDVIEGRHYVTLYVVAQSPAGEPRLMEPRRCAGWHWFAWSGLPEPLFAPLASIRAAGFVPDGTG